MTLDDHGPETFASARVYENVLDTHQDLLQARFTGVCKNDGRKHTPLGEEQRTTRGIIVPSMVDVEPNQVEAAIERSSQLITVFQTFR